MTITLACGHVFTDAADDTLLGDRVICDHPDHNDVDPHLRVRMVVRTNPTPKETP